MLDKESRNQIAVRIGDAVDDLVKDLYSELQDGVSLRQEPEITSRLCQRLEDRLDNVRAGHYVFRVIAQSLPDRGPRSLEKIFGADLFISISLDGVDGFDKGIFIQAKYDRNIDRSELLDACDKMRKLGGDDGVYCLVYRPTGARVLSAFEVEQMRGNRLTSTKSRSMSGFARRVLDCHAGSKAWGISAQGAPLKDRRKLVDAKLIEARAENILDIHLKDVHGRRPRR